MLTILEAPLARAQEPDAGWMDDAASPCDAASLLRAKPDFNDPLIRSLPFFSLAIALALMERGRAQQ